MAELTTKKRNNLSKKSFALPGSRAYPIPDKNHARNALARVSQFGTPAQKAEVKSKVKSKFPSIGKKGGVPQRKNNRHMTPMEKLSKGMKGINDQTKA